MNVSPLKASDLSSSSTPLIKKTDLGYQFGDLEILFGINGVGGVLRANSLVMHGPEKIVVDPAGAEEQHKILAKENPILFFTHYHGDHRMSEHYYSDECRVWTTADDEDAVASVENCAQKISGGSSEMAKMTLVGMLEFMKLRDWTIERSFKDDELVEAGGCQARIVHLPGHTPGHSGMFFPEQSLLYTTDIDLTSFGPWYGNKVSNLQQFKESVKKVRDYECDWYYTSHGEAILDRQEFLTKLDAFEAHFERRDNLILDALAEGEKSIDELCHLEVVYREKTLKKMPHMIHMEKIHVLSHLQELEKEGRVKADEKFERFHC